MIVAENSFAGLLKFDVPVLQFDDSSLFGQLRNELEVNRWMVIDVNFLILWI
jgi:hypothetical protein